MGDPVQINKAPLSVVASEKHLGHVLSNFPYGNFGNIIRDINVRTNCLRRYAEFFIAVDRNDFLFCFALGISLLFFLAFCFCREMTPCWVPGASAFRFASRPAGCLGRGIRSGLARAFCVTLHSLSHGQMRDESHDSSRATPGCEEQLHSPLLRNKGIETSCSSTLTLSSPSTILL